MFNRIHPITVIELDHFFEMYAISEEFNFYQCYISIVDALYFNDIITKNEHKILHIAIETIEVNNVE